MEIVGRHEVLFCPDDEALVARLTRFVAAALNGEDAAIALVTESHRSRLLHELRAQDVDRCVDALVANRARYEQVQNATGVPWYVVAIIHNMEASQNFKRHLHNGDPLTARRSAAS